MKTFSTINLGCRVNLYEINAVIYQMVKNGFKFVDDINKANIVIVNTCSVTNKADAKSRNMINRAKHAKLKPIVLVMGCFSQLNKEWFKDNHIDIVLGTQYKNKLVQYLNTYLKNHKPIFKIDKQKCKFEEFGFIEHINNTRAVLKIQDGCNYRCSYCCIPFARGNARSMNHNHILQLIRDYVKSGYKEIVITGVNTSQYCDKDYSFLNLLQDINKMKGNFRVRLSSVEPFQMDRKIIDLFASNPQRWANYFHICLQNANNDILKQMNRKYTIEEYINFIKYIRSKMPNVSITTDYIVGFGNETNQQFNDGLKNLKKINFSNINVFIYSRRKNTIADKKYVKDVNPIISRERFNKVIELKNRCAYSYAKSFIGKTLDVLVEKSTAPNMHGYSSEFLKVIFKSRKNLQNQMVKVKIYDVGCDRFGCYLKGKKIKI